MKHSDYLKKKKTRETRKKIISVISAIVVFITTYALVLPAITLDVSKASQEPGIAFEQMQFKTTASAASVTAADSTVEVQVEEAQVEEPEAEAPAEEAIQEEPAESSEEEVSAVSDEQEEIPAEPEQVETPAEPEQEQAPATETEEVQEDKSEESSSETASSSETDSSEAQAADTQKTAEQTDVDQSGTEATDAAAAATTAETAAEFQIPTLDALDFDDILTDKTAFYYYHPENAEEAENLSSDSIDDWKKAGSDTVLAPEDFVRVYLSYEIPAGALNETNTVARYRLPEGLELSDKQIKAINKYENGIAASKSGSEKDKYLGAEAIEGSRTPDEKADDEYISATVKVEKTDNGGQELVFTFIPYTVEKNQVSYDDKGNVKSKGKEVKGFFSFDLKTSQIDFDNTNIETVEKEDGTTEEIQYSEAKVVFADKDSNWIERDLTLASPVEKEEAREPKTLTSEGTDYTVTVSYVDEAQIPDNAELTVREIEKDTEEYASYLEQAKGAVDETKSINEARFFDISILVDGEKVEPQAPVSVQINFAGIEQTNTDDTQLLHYKDSEEVEVMDKAEFSKSEEQAVDTVQFETDGFSVYGIVGTEAITTQFITAEGKTYQVTVTYGPDANIPRGSTLVVNELLTDDDSYNSYKADTAAALNTSEEDMRYIKLLDISIMNGDEKVEIAAPVDVEITLLDKEKAEQERDDGEAAAVQKDETNTEETKTEKFEMRVVHFGQDPQEVEAANIGETVSFSADSFSVYAIVGTTVQAEFLTADGRTLKVTVTFDKDEPLPADAVLEVKELQEQDDEKLYGDRYQRLSNVLYTNYGKSKTGESRFLSISIYSEGREYKPKYPIQVKINYDEAIYQKDERLVTVHYPDNENNLDVEDELNEAFIEEAEILDSKNTLDGSSVVETVFETTGFSDYDITTLGADDSPEFSSKGEPAAATKAAAEEAPPLKAPVLRAAGDTPEHLKEIEDNGDGTYTLDLSVTGEADTTVEEAGNVNVLIVYDHSSSMTSRVSGGTATRADQAEDVVYDFVHSLFGYQSSTNPSNIQVGLVRFARTADSTTNWTSTESTITQYFDNGGTDGTTNQNYSSSNNANNGTNWQSALSSARNLLNSADADPTFVIFVTDGAPTASGNGNNAINPSGASLNQLRPFYEAAQSDARTIQTRDNTTLFGIYCYGTEADLLDDLMYYSNTGSARTARTQTDLPVDHYYNTGNTEALSAAIDEIFHQIVEALGIHSVSIHDGTTNQVTTTTGQISELLEVDESTYKYWISIPYVNNSFTRIDLVTGEEITYNLRNNGNGTVTVTWGNNSVTVTGTMNNGVFKYQWTEANALYNFAPPAAHMTNGAVDWDLSNVGTLLNGVTYTVSFECYPSQYTLDLIADLKNGYEDYDSLDANIKKYLHKEGNDYTLSTNTQATLTYSDSRNGTGPITTEFNDVDPQGTAATKSIAIAKDWSNILDSREKPDELKMHVTRDGDDRYELTLNDADSWQDSAFISYGIITIHDGNVVMKTSGHDYSFSEPKDMEYYWELDVPTLRPMLINAVETMLVKVDQQEAPSMSGDNATAERDGVTYYKLTINGTAEYYKVDAAVASLKATNNRRSYLNVTKKVDEENAPADAEFSFDMNVVNSRASEGSAEDTDSDYWVWFSVYDTINNVTVSGDDLTISGTDLQGPNSDGFYWIPSGNTVTVGMKKGYNLRFLNLPTDSTYSITESSTMPEESFSLESITGNRHYKDEDEVERDEAAGTKSDFGISGTIEYANSNYTMTFDNKYSTIDVQLEKVDENGNTISGSTFDLSKYTSSWTSVKTDIKPGDTATSTPNPVDLGGLGIGRYRLTETEAPVGYIILTNHVYFEVYKDTDGVLKARLTDESGAPVTSPTDTAAIDGPGTGDTPTYTVTVENTPGAALPMTGGPGTFLYTLSGIALIFASALMYGFRMRRRERRLN